MKIILKFLILIVCALVFAEVSMFYDNNYSPEAKALKRLEESCDQKDAAACLELGDKYRHRSSRLSADVLEKVYAYVRKACEYGSGEGCVRIGARYRVGDELPQDFNLAREYLQKGCDTGAPDGCAVLGHLYMNGDGVPREPETARRYYQKSCDGGSGLGCYSLGRIYLANDFDDAGISIKDLFLKACASQILDSCEIVRKLAEEERFMKQEQQLSGSSENVADSAGGSDREAAQDALEGSKDK